MFYPKYLLLLNNQSFKSKACCLSSQISAILSVMFQDLLNTTCYGCDIESIPSNCWNKELKLTTLKKIDSYQNLIERLKTPCQFLSGVFLFSKDSFSNCQISNINSSTEDDRFRELSLSSVLIEIRAFDCSYFEIYTTNKVLLHKIESNLKGEIISK